MTSPEISEEVAEEEVRHDVRAAQMGLVKLQPGDVVPIKGLHYIVEHASSSRAYCLPLGGRAKTITNKLTGEEATFNDYGSAQSIASHVEPSFILERAGREMLRQFLETKTKTKLKPTMKLEPGDGLTYEGEPQVVFAVNDTHARIADLTAYQGTVVERDINDFFLSDKPRLTEEQRRQRLHDFIGLANGRAKELTKEITVEEMEKTTMSKTALSKGGLAADAIRAKRGAGKPKTEKKAKANGAAKAARKEATVSRNAFIDARLDGKMTKRGIAQAVVDAKFGCTFEQALKAANDRPFYMRKEGKSPSWKAEEKAVEPKAEKK